MLESRRFTKDMECYREVRRLYNASFPRNERIPWHSITSGLNDSKRMYVYSDRDRLIGLSHLMISGDIAYLGYLAVEENMRNKGYGTAILENISKELSDFRIVTDIEAVNEEADNYEKCRSRKDFYLRNGFESDGVGYTFFQVDYELLSCHGPVTAEEYRNLIREHWGAIAGFAKFHSFRTK